MEFFSVKNIDKNKNIVLNKNILKSSSVSNNVIASSPETCKAICSGNYFNPSFGISMTHSSEMAAKKLLSSFGFDYLSPGKVWSKDKIFSTISSIGNNIDTLMQKNDLSANTVKGIIKGFLTSEESKKIVVKDICELKEDLAKIGIKGKAARGYLNSDAFTINYEGKSTIYTNFAHANDKDDFYKVRLKNSICHELKHALSSNFTNTANIDFFNLQIRGIVDEPTTVSRIFSEIEDYFVIETCSQNAKPIFENLLINLDIDSKKDFYMQLKNATSNVIEDFITEGKLSCKNKQSKKLLLTALKHEAEDEKEAYQFNKFFRKFAKNKDKPTDWELMPVLYEKMAEFYDMCSKL